jgi:hypothetical protein
MWQLGCLKERSWFLPLEQQQQQQQQQQQPTQ